MIVILPQIERQLHKVGGFVSRLLKNPWNSGRTKQMFSKHDGLGGGEKGDWALGEGRCSLAEPGNHPRGAGPGMRAWYLPDGMGRALACQSASQSCLTL